MKIFETIRLYINSPSLKNIENLVALFSDPEVMRYVGHGVRNRQETRKKIEMMIKQHEKYGFICGDVYEKASNQFVGRAGLVYLDGNENQPDIELSYTLHKKFWGRGYATELVKALIAWGFDNLPIEKLVAVAQPDNKGSRHVMEKVGMQYVGLAYCHEKEVAKYELLKEVYVSSVL